jgi:hypothetical protein
MVQSIKITYNNSSDTEAKLYCPFTGQCLNDEEIPNSVALLLSEMEPTEPVYINSEWRESFDLLIEKDEDVFLKSEEIAAWLSKMDATSSYLVIRFEQYGSLPGDYGHLLYVLRNPY